MRVAYNAVEGNFIDMSCLEITTSEGTYAVKNTSPSGKREIILARTTLLRPGDYNSTNYRIPAVITARNGDVVAVTDKRKYNNGDLPEDIDIVCNVCSDGGHTWTEPYMSNDQVVVVKNGSGITSLADLAGLKVAVQKDSSGLAALNENEALTSTFGELVEIDSYLQAMMELEMGSVDAIVMDEIVARYEIQTSGKDFAVLDEAVASEEYGVGFLLGNTALRDEVQKTLEEMAADGTMAKISEKWFGADVTIIGK